MWFPDVLMYIPAIAGRSFKKTLFPWSRLGGKRVVVCYGFLAQLGSLQETSEAQISIYKPGRRLEKQERSVWRAAAPCQRHGDHGVVQGVETEQTATCVQAAA